MKITELHNQPVQPDTYEASMALNQLLKIGKHAIKIHNMIDDAAEMESWVAKKIDLAGDYVKKVHGYMQGEKAGLYDDGGMTEDDNSDYIKQAYMLAVKHHTDGSGDGNINEDIGDLIEDYNEKATKKISPEQIMRISKKYNAGGDYVEVLSAEGIDGKLWLEVAKEYYSQLESVSEDAGEGHMSKSTLYHTAKYAIELMDMINKGDDLEGWVQSKLNKAADYLQGVHNYEEYQKLNPYREELDSELLQKHAGIIQKNIDEILARETSLDDVDTKPGMMKILAKRVNEVEKEIAKEQRKNTDEAHGGQHTTSGRSMTKGEMNKREKIVKGMKKDKAGFKKRYGKDAEAVMYATATKQAMKDDVDYRSDDVLIKAGFDPAMVKKYIAVFNDHGDTSDIDQMNMDKIGLADAMSMTLASHGIENESVEESGILYRAGVKKYGKAGMKAIQSAAAKGANHQEIGKIKDKHLKDDEQMQEGIKDWAKNLAMAGVIVAGLAGVGSIQDAIDRSVPAVQAMETALELAQDQGNTELADMIKKDLSAVKVRLSSGKDLGFVKGMQEKYSKFVKTEGLAYESRLAIMLNQQLK